MRRLLKFIFGGILAFLAIAIVAIIILVGVVDPNDFKDQASKVVYQKTGRTLAINGDISWRFFPWLGLKVKDVTLSNPQGFAVEEFAKIGEVDIAVRLLPLVDKRIEMGELVLKDAKLNFIREGSGKNNWQDLITMAQDEEVVKDSASQASSPLKHISEADFVPFSIADLDIVNSELTYQDRVTDKKVSLQRLNFSADDISLSSPFDFDLSFILDNKKPQMKGAVKLRALADFDLENKLYSLKNLKLSGEYLRDNLANKVPFDINANITADLKQQFLTVNGLEFDLASVKGSGLLKGEKIIDAPVFNGKMNFKVASVNKFLTFLGNFSQLKKDIKDATLDFSLNASPKFLKLKNVVAVLDDTKVQGNIDFTNFTGPSFTFSAYLNKLSSDRYAMVDKQKTTSKKSAATKMKSDFNFDGLIEIADLNLAKLKAKNADIHLVGRGKTINLNKITANIYQGSLFSSARINLAGNKPRISANAKLTNIALQPLFVDLADLDKLTGTANLSLNVSSTGSNMTAILRDLDGKGSLMVDNGVWHGVDVRYQINRANSILNKKASPTETKPPRTEFGRLTGSFIISDGLLRNDDLLIRSPHFKVDGHGTANLVTEDLDFRLEALGIKKVTDAAGNISEQTGSFAVPIKISGKISDPKVRPDVGNLIQKAVIKSLTEGLTKSVGEKAKQLNLPEVSDKLIKGLNLDKLF